MLLALCATPLLLLLTLSLTLNHLLPLCSPPLLRLLTLNLTLLHLLLALSVPLLLLLLLPLSVLYLTLLILPAAAHLALFPLSRLMLLLSHLLLTLTAVTATLLLSRRPSATISAASFITFPLRERRANEYNRDREHRNKSHKNKIRPHISTPCPKTTNKTQFVIPFTVAITVPYGIKRISG